MFENLIEFCFPFFKIFCIKRKFQFFCININNSVLIGNRNINAFNICHNLDAWLNRIVVEDCRIVIFVANFDCCVCFNKIVCKQIACITRIFSCSSHINNFIACWNLNFVSNRCLIHFNTRKFNFYNACLAKMNISYNSRSNVVLVITFNNGFNNTSKVDCKFDLIICWIFFVVYNHFFFNLELIHKRIHIKICKINAKIVANRINKTCVNANNFCYKSQNFCQIKSPCCSIKLCRQIKSVSFVFQSQIEFWININNPNIKSVSVVSQIQIARQFAVCKIECCISTD